MSVQARYNKIIIYAEIHSWLIREHLVDPRLLETFDSKSTIALDGGSEPDDWSMASLSFSFPVVGCYATLYTGASYSQSQWLSRFRNIDYSTDKATRS
jgi:hypothetical protein